MSARSAASPRVVLLVATSLWACGGGEPSAPPAARPLSPSEASKGIAAAAAERSAYRAEDLPTLFAAQLPEASAPSLPERARRLVADDDWETEKLHERSEPVLDAFLAALLAEGGAPEALARSLSSAFEGATRVRPAELSVVLDDGATRVLEPPAEELAALPLSGPAELSASAADLRAALGAASPAVQALTVGLEPRGERSFDTRVLLIFDGRDGDAPVQVNATWLVGWALEPDGEPRIRSLRLARYQELRSQAELLCEVTEAVFGGEPCWKSEFLRGVDDWFMRVDRRSGLAFQGMQGLAVGDVNGDGLEDVYACMPVGTPNRLFIARPDGTVTDRAAEGKVDYLEVTRSALIVDLDGDGWRDLVLAMGPSILLALNDGTGVFSRQKELQAQGEEQFYSISAADGDGDGDLDLFGCRYALGGVMHGAPSPYHDADNGASDYYWRNDGRGQFSDATEESGIAANNRKFGLANIWEDFDLDGDLDLYVINDFGRKNLWRNDGTGHFVDAAAEMGLEDIAAGMGVTCADYDLDGDLDVYLSNMFSAPGLRIASQERFLRGRHPELRPWYVKHARGNTLLANRGDGTFEDQSEASGATQGGWAWGAKFIDFNADGYADLYVPNGQTTSRREPYDLEGFFWRRVIDQSPIDPSTVEGYRAAFDAIQDMMMFGGMSWNGHERNNAYLNLANGRFAEASHLSGADFVQDSRSVATLDWDGDGREDCLLKSRSAPRLRLLLNRDRSANHTVTFELDGRPPNRDAIGALVTVTAGGRSQGRRIYAGDGYLAQSSPRLCFGLGRAERIESVEVRWPDGSRSQYRDLSAGRHYRLDQRSAAPQEMPRRPVTALAGLDSVHAQRNLAPVDRVVLAERLPMAAFPLPAFEGQGRRVADFAGQPLLVHVWTAAHESGRQALSELAAAVPAVAETGCRVVCLAVDEGLDLARAREESASTPFAAQGGYADGRMREALLVLVIEVLGFFEPIPLPTSFLLDAQGQLCVLYTGPADPASIAADAAVVAELNPRQRGTTKLSGGRWLRPPRRDLDTLSKVLGAAGFEDLAAFYADLVAGSAQRASDPSEDEGR